MLEKMLSNRARVGVVAFALSLSVQSLISIPVLAQSSDSAPAGNTVTTTTSQGSSSTKTNNTTTTTETTTSTTSTGETTQKAPLEAGVQVVILSLERLRDVGLDLKHLQHTAGELYDEVNIAPVTLETMPEMIGSTVIYIPVNTRTVGPPAPPRPARLASIMDRLRDLSTQMKSDVDAFQSGERQLQMPGNMAQEMQGELQQWVANVNDIYSQFQALEPLTAGPTYDNAAISQRATAIQQDAKQLESIRRLLHKTLQKEGKREAALKKKSKNS